jgi:tape measure domain-containing protein
MEKNVRYKIEVDRTDLLAYNASLEENIRLQQEQIAIVNSSSASAKQASIEYKKQLAEIRQAYLDNRKELNETNANYKELTETQKRMTLDAKAQTQERISDAKAEAKERMNQSDAVKAKAIADEKIRTQEANDASRARLVQEKAEAQARLIELKKQAGAYDDLSNTVKTFATMVVSAFSIREVYQFGMQVIDAKTKVDLFSMALSDMIGNKQKSDQINAEVIKIAQKSPFEVEQLMETTLRLKAMGVETDKLIPYINTLGDISSRVGIEKLPLIAKAMTDVQNKGKLMAQEIKQFTDNGVPLFDLLAKSMEKPREEVIKLAENHKIAFADVEKALMDATKVGGVYYNSMATASKTLGGQVSNLADIYFIAKARIGTFYEDTLQSAIETTKDLMTATIGSESALQRTTEAIKAGASAIGTYVVATKGVALAQSLWNGVNEVTKIVQGELILLDRARTGSMAVMTVAQTEATVAATAFNTALRANPLALVVTAIGGLITAYYAYKAINTEVLEVQSAEIDNAQKQVVSFNQLTSKLANAKQGTDEYKNTVIELQKQFPAYFSNLSTEKNNHDAVTTAIALTNRELQKKIQLAVLNAKAEQLSEKALEVEKQRYDIVQKLRAENSALSKQYANDLQFVQELAKAQKSITITTSMGGSTLDMNAINQQIKNYESLGSVAESTIKQINKLTDDSEQIRTSINAREINNLKRQLRDKLENHKGNLEAQKQDQEWYTKEVEKLGKTEVAIAKTVGEDKVKNQNITSAKLKEILAETELETKTMTFATVDEIYKKKFEALKAERDDRIKQAQATYKDINSETKAILDIQAKYLKDRDTITKSYEASWKSLRQQEYIQVNEIQRGVVQLTTESTKARIDKEKETTKQLAQINADYQKQYQSYLDTLNKRDDARAVYEEVLSAKTQHHKMAIITKYGKKTDDEILANTIKRLKAEEEAQTRHLKFLEITYGKDSVQYKAYQVIAQKTTTDRVDAEKKYFTKASLDRLHLYEKESMQYQKMLSDTIKLASNAFDNMTKTVNGFANDSVSNLKKSYDAQYKLLGDNIEAKIELTKKFAKTEEELMISNARFQRFTSFLSNLTREFSNYNDKRMQFEEQYQIKVVEINKSTMSDFDKANQIKIAGTEKTLNNIASITQSALSLVSSYYQMEYNFKIQQLDAELEYTRKATQEQIDLATQIKDEKIKLINEEEKAKLDTLEKQRKAELDSLEKQRKAQLEALGLDYDDRKSAISKRKSDLEKEQNDKLDALSEAYKKEKDELQKAKDEEIRIINEQRRQDLISADDASRAKEALDIKYDDLRSKLDDKYNQDRKSNEDDYASKKEAINKELEDLENAHANSKLEIDKRYSEEKEKIEKKYADASVEITKNATDQKTQINDQYTKDVNSLNEEQAKREDEIERQKFEAQKEMMITQILLQALMAEAALLPYYAALVTLPYAIAAAVAIAVASAAMIAKVSSMSYKSPLGSKYDQVGWTGSVKGGTYTDPNYNPNLGQEGGKPAKTEDAPYGGQTADEPGTPGPDGHEMPVGNDYDQEGNYVRSIYETYPPVRDENGKILYYPEPRTTPNFFKGSDYVDIANQYPSGIDTVPARVNKGERIIPTDLNEQIGGARLSNQELVDNLKVYNNIKELMPNLVKNFEMNMVVPEGLGSQKDVATIEELVKLRHAIENKSMLKVNIDGYKMTIEEERHNYKARYIDKMLVS